MKNNYKKIVSIFALCIFLVQGIPVHALERAIGTIETKTLGETDTILSTGYLNSFKANVSKVENNGGQYIGKIDKAFDGNWDTSWQTGKANSSTFKNEVVVTFAETSSISKIIYQTTKDRDGGYGYPKSLSIYASSTDDGDNYAKVAVGTSVATSDKVQFTLSETIQAKRVKFVYEEAQLNWAAAAEIMFIKEDPALDKVVNIFSTIEKYSLKQEYNSYEAIGNIEKMIKNHPAKDALMVDINRAYKILNGEIDNENIPEKAMDFPVHTIQKTGPDSEKMVLLFMGDGYTASEQDKFISDITERVNKLLSIEPYKEYANEFNIYAMKVESNESGIGRFASSGQPAINKDTYFKIKFNYMGVERGTYFSSGGDANARNLSSKFAANYLDKGAKVFHTSILLNSETYGGAGGEFSISSLAAGEFMVAHESAHTFAGLKDEYFAPSQGEAPNRTMYNDPLTIKWKEFLGFRGVGIYLNGTEYNGTKIYKPSNGTCLMESLYVNEFCEVCKHWLAKTFNDNIKNKKDIYVANPSVTVESTNTTLNGKEVTNENITDANNQEMKLRTVIQNFTKASKNFKLKLTVTNEQGQAKSTVEKDFTIGADALKSIEVKSGLLTGLTSGDKVIATVVDKDTNKEVSSNKKEKYGTITVDYKFGNEESKTNNNIPVVAKRTITVKANTEYVVQAPKLKNYVSTVSNIDTSTILVKEGTNTNVTYYYANSKGPVNLVLKDTKGQVVKSYTKYLPYKTTFTPSKADFAHVDGYNVTAPTKTVTYNGLDNLETIEYAGTATGTGTQKEKEVKIRAISKNVVIGEISLGKKTSGTTIEVNAPTVAQIPGLSEYKLATDAVKTIVLANDEITEVIDFEYTKNEVVEIAPSLSGVVDKTIKVGDVFDKMAGITAKDQFNNDITSGIIVDGSVNTAVAGKYTLTYTATDSRGLKTTLARIITVESNPVVEGDTFDSSKIYNTGDIVVYKGEKYKAKYWTQGGTPDTNAAWEKVVDTNPDGTKPYVPGLSYNKGDLVSY
ncbi:MAG: M64 family metallopeptidase, partial [Clostridium sp.]